MKKLDRRGVAALEFAFVAAPLFKLMVVIFDMGRYAIAAQSPRAHANAEARARMIAAIPKVSPAGRTSNQMSTTNRQAAAPFLYAGGLAPAMSAAAANTLAIKATQPGFAVRTPIWGATLSAHGASTNIAASPAKDSSFATTVALTPLVVMPALCRSGNANRCAVTLSCSERFQ